MAASTRTSAAGGPASVAPRSSHGAWEPAADRPDPVALLEEQAADRVEELVPIRYGRMLASPFAFYRGAAAVMAADLAATPMRGDHRPGLRRCPPGQLRRLRRAGRRLDLRHQRLRRDASRAVGVGRQAPGGEPRDRRRATASSARAAGAGRSVAPRMSTASRCGGWRRWGASGLVRARRPRRADADQFARRGRRETSPVRQEPRQAQRKTSSGASPSCPRGRRRAPDRQRPAADHAARGAARRLLDDAAPGRVGDVRGVPRDASAGTSASCSTATGSSTSPARWSASAASGPGPGSSSSMGRDDGDPLFLQIKEAQRSVLEPHAAKSIYGCRGAASSRASG